MSENNWRCLECDWVGPLSSLLSGLNPFDQRMAMLGCPECKEVNCFREVCDVAGCVQETTCGTPTAQGYRRTCFKHSPFALNVDL